MEKTIASIGSADSDHWRTQAEAAHAAPRRERNSPDDVLARCTL